MTDGQKVGSSFVEVEPKLAGNFKSIIEKAMPSGSKGGSKFGSDFSSGMAGAVSAGAVAVGNILSDVVEKGASAAKDLIGDALSGFSDFEQLSGGVEKLFGEEAAQTVMANAEKAFASAGMSANQYMEQATSFSAALIGSLGDDTARAAELTDVAMRAMSDNVNVFGSDMQDVQNAFQGFAKQNYTMLDNLKLGYGGTKSEMERLIADANEYAAANGQAADLSIDSFADIVQAIELVQEKQGIAGTTAKEAASTVEGSVNMMKASWENWIASLGRDDVDMSAKTDELLSSVETAAQNVLPRLSQIFDSAVGALPGLISGIAPAVVPLVSDLLVSVVDSAGELVATTLPELVPVLTSSARSLVSALLPALVSMLPMLLEAGLQMFTGLVLALGEIAPQLTAMLPGLISQLLSVLLANLPALISASVQLFLGIALGLVQALPEIVSTLVSMLPVIFQTLIDARGELLDAAGQLFRAIGQALVEVGPMIVEALGYLITHLPEIIVDGIGGMVGAAGQLFGGIVDGIMGKEPEVEQAASDATRGAVDAAFASSDGSRVAENLTSTMAASFDFGEVDAAVVGGVDAAAGLAAASADGSAVSSELTSTMAQSVDLTALDKPASDLVGNAVASARKAVMASDVGREFSDRAAKGIDVNAMVDAAARMASKASENLNFTSTIKVNADLAGANAVKAAASAVAASYMATQASIRASMAAASTSARVAGSTIRSALSGLDFKATVKVDVGPLPHFYFTGEFNAKTKSVPKLHVDWYAEGAIFAPGHPGLIGIGDARVPEVAAPVDKLQDMLDFNSGSGEVNVYLNYDASADAQQMARDVARKLKRYKMAGVF